MEYKDMTDEEYDALDEELTRTVPKLGPNQTDWLTQRELYRLGLTNVTVTYLLTKATADHTSPGKIINDMVCKEIAAAV